MHLEGLHLQIRKSESLILRTLFENRKLIRKAPSKAGIIFLGQELSFAPGNIVSCIIRNGLIVER